MNARLLPLAAATGLLAGLAGAQQSSTPQPVTHEVRDAGTLHLATGTWTRRTTGAALVGPQALYDNTCTIGFFLQGSVGQVILDSGRVPSSSSPSNSVSLTGTADAYQIDAFDIGYCSLESTAPSAQISFFDCYSACSLGPLPSPIASFTLVNLPFGTGTTPGGCWVMTIDLANTTLDFPLSGDCDGIYDGAPPNDDFAWSWATTAPQAATLTGPLIAGDPLGLFNSSCGTWGDGTTFAGSNPNVSGTGIGALDQFESNQPLEGCFFFGGYGGTNPFASFYMRLSGDGVANPGSNGYCFGDGSSGACPCGNAGNPGQGCGNSTGTQGARLVASGTPSISNDTIQFGVSGVPGSKPGVLIRGINQVTMPSGDGLLCASGQSGRSQVVVTSASGNATISDYSGSPFGLASYGPGVVANYQFWYRDPQSTCTGAGFNFTNAWSLLWMP